MSNEELTANTKGRIFDKLDDLVKEVHAVNTKVDELKSDIEKGLVVTQKDVESLEKEIEEIKGRIGVLEVSEREQQKLIHRGEGVKWVLGGVAALILSAISGLIVYFVMK